MVKVREMILQQISELVRGGRWGAQYLAGDYFPELKYEEVVHDIQVEPHVYNPDLNVDFGIKIQLGYLHRLN